MTWHSGKCKRLVLEVTPSEHEEIKTRADDLEITIRGYLYGAIQLRIEMEDKGILIRPQDKVKL